MAPQIIRMDTGRIIAVCNFPSIGNSSESAIDPITGKIFISGSVSAAKIDSEITLRFVTIPPEWAVWRGKIGEISLLSVSGSGPNPTIYQVQGTKILYKNQYYKIRAEWGTNLNLYYTDILVGTTPSPLPNPYRSDYPPPYTIQVLATKLGNKVKNFKTSFGIDDPTEYICNDIINPFHSYGDYDPLLSGWYEIEACFN